MQMQPVGMKERYSEVDSLRGIALLGILLVNMLFFHSPYIYFDPFNWYTAPADKAGYQFIDIFVQASFYPLFAMLFGFGLATQFQRFEGAFIKFGMKRMAVLLAFGIAHVLSLWAGDILITYAAAGFVLLFLLRLSTKWLLALGILFYMIPNGAITLLLLVVQRLDPESTAVYTDVQGIEQSIAAYGQGGFSDIFVQRLADWNFMNQGGLFLIWMLFTIVPLLMFGAAAAKGHLISKIRISPMRFLAVGLIFIALGTAVKWIPYLTQGDLVTGMIQDTFGGPVQAIGYGLLLLSLASKTSGFIGWRPFVKAGRMSLTIYLLMSLIATTFFYNYGFGFYGKVDIQASFWIALGIYAICVIFAELWLSKAKQGPAEWLWRKLTYPTNK